MKETALDSLTGIAARAVARTFHNFVPSPERSSLNPFGFGSAGSAGPAGSARPAGSAGHVNSWQGLSCRSLANLPATAASRPVPETTQCILTKQMERRLRVYEEAPGFSPGPRDSNENTRTVSDPPKDARLRRTYLKNVRHML